MLFFHRPVIIIFNVFVFNIIADYQRTGGNRLHSIGLQSARGRGVPNVTGAGESIQLYDGRW